VRVPRTCGGVTIDSDQIGPDQIDRELWAAAVDGDADAFAQLYQRHADRIYAYCFRRSASWSTAQDLTSVVFLEAWRRRRSVRLHDGATVRGWLFGVANNVLRSSERACRRYRAALASLPSGPAEQDFADDLAARLDDERGMRTVPDVMGRLPRSD
jgi:DNA-directed RNA polymerase specialized sigma24 family protein